MKGMTIFTIGSCFARSLEDNLPGFLLPTKAFSVPKTERLGRPNGILNEYNPGTMCQRIEFAKNEVTFEDKCIAKVEGGYIDLLLTEFVTPSTIERIMERRSEVDKLYSKLFNSDAVFITLDLIEGWYDKHIGLYLNRIPPTEYLSKNRKRFEIHILDISESYSLLERIVLALIEIGIRRILIAVSPIPLEVTYSGKDCFAANMYSKAVLVVCAHKLSLNFPEVDYFPGYEIVTSAGNSVFESDSIHVRDDFVERVTAFMVSEYIAST